MAKATGETPAGRVAAVVYDEPTWTWDWIRSEPTFGQNQARVAGELLAKYGRVDDALRAFVWARAVDGPDLRILRGLEALLEPRAKRSPMAEEALFAVRGELEGLPHGLVGGVPQTSLGEPLDLDLAAIEVAVVTSLQAAESLDAVARRGKPRGSEGLGASSGSLAGRSPANSSRMGLARRRAGHRCRPLRRARPATGSKRP